MKIFATLLLVAAVAMPSVWAAKATCVLQSGSTNGVAGTMTLTQDSPRGSTSITGRVSGLSPGNHGFHVHEYGDYSNGCLSFGGFFNPSGAVHGGPNSPPGERMAGSLGNIQADENGVAMVSITDEQIPLFGENSIIGRGIAITEKADDLGRGGNEESKKTGNSGRLLACCVIGTSK